MRIVIVDYGMGNLLSITGALKHLGYTDVGISSEAQTLAEADKLILPGVGNFAKAIKVIYEKRLDKTLHDLVSVKKKPILGICLGMQLLGKSSTEGGYNHGLNFVDGVVEKLPEGESKVPHVGYNQVKAAIGSRLFAGIKNQSDFYFTHSYRMQSDANIGQSICDYSQEFVASFEVENVAGVQFHPEISQRNGLKLLANFLEKF